MTRSEQRLRAALDTDFPGPHPALATWALSSKSFLEEERKMAIALRRRDRMLALAGIAIALVIAAAVLAIKTPARHVFVLTHPAPTSAPAKSVYQQRVDADWAVVQASWNAAGADCHSARSARGTSLPENMPGCRQDLLAVRTAVSQMQTDLGGVSVPSNQAANDQKLRTALGDMSSALSTMVTDLDAQDPAAYAYGPQATLESQNLLPIITPYLQARAAVNLIDR